MEVVLPASLAGMAAVVGVYGMVFTKPNGTAANASPVTLNADDRRAPVTAVQESNRSAASSNAASGNAGRMVSNGTTPSSNTNGNSDRRKFLPSRKDGNQGRNDNRR